jgi:uncharacterized membrane protein
VTAFDLKSVLLAKHAQHVVLIHFPIALFLTGVLFDFAGLWKRRTALATAACVNLISAALSVLPVMASGVLAWQWQLDGQRLKGVLLLHLVLGSISGLLIGVTGWIHFRSRRAPGASLPYYRLPLEFVAALMVILTGHLGGILSGVNIPS